MKKLIGLLFALGLLAGAASAQTWALVSMEGTTLTAMPVGTTWRFGSPGNVAAKDPGGFSASFVSTAANPKLPIYIYYTSFTFPDPDSGFSKGFYVAEGAAAYSVVYTDTSGVSHTVLIPVAPVIPPPVVTPPTTNSCTNGTATTYTLTSSVTFNAAGFIIAGTPGMTCQ